MNKALGFLAVLAVVALCGCASNNAGASKGADGGADDGVLESELTVAVRVLAYYESGYLAARAEAGGDNVTRDEIIGLPEDSDRFVFSVNEDGSMCTATAKTNIGRFKKGDNLTSKYDKDQNGFVHGSSRPELVRRFIPTFL